MKKLVLLIFCSIMLVSCGQDDALKIDVENDENAAREAFYYLNDIRENPATFSNQLNINLSGVSPMSRLRWNDKLAKVAFDKAKSMAQNGYLSITYPNGTVVDDKLRETGYEVFGSSWVSYGWNYSDGRTFISKAVSNLVPMIECRGFHEDVGIAFIRAEGAQQSTYVVCIIATDEDKGPCGADSTSGGNSDGDDGGDDDDDDGGGNTDDDGSTGAGDGGN